MGPNRLARRRHLIWLVRPRPRVDLGPPLVQVLLKAAADRHLHRRKRPQRRPGPEMIGDRPWSGHPRSNMSEAVSLENSHGPPVPGRRRTPAEVNQQHPCRVQDPDRIVYHGPPTSDQMKHVAEHDNAEGRTGKR